jgi:hypothetical protein
MRIGSSSGKGAQVLHPPRGVDHKRLPRAAPASVDDSISFRNRDDRDERALPRGAAGPAPHLAETPRIVNLTVPQDDWSQLGELAVER